ncbi:MAG: hypothetical protein ABII09_09815 [Planctomycetota bacterium]
MNYKKMLKSTHLASMVWFMLCVGYVSILAMWEAGFKWWLIFSLSGHLALLVTLLASLYLFAIFKGAYKDPDMQQEHPLTSTCSYLVFYVSAPLFGALAGAAAMIGETRIFPFFTGIAMGTLATTCLTWVIVDPLASTLEMLASVSREHRLRRLSTEKRRREDRRREREELLSALFKQQAQNQLRWQELLAPEVEKLTELLSTKSADFEQAEHEAVDIGIRAWQIGGLECMRRLRNTAMELYNQRHRNLTITDYISNWWDGIGNWRTPAAG